MKKIIDFYIHSSLHVSLAVVSLVVLTYYLFGLSIDVFVLLFVFSSSVAGYNYTKYNTLIMSKKKSTKLKAIFVLSLVCGFVAFWAFWKLSFVSKWLMLFTAIMTLLYAIPLPKGKNFRNLSGIKIYVVALCWVASTLLLPVLQSEYTIDINVFIKSIQRFLLVIILILIFEIIDLKEDNLSLRTVPQAIGVKKTKLFGSALLVLFFCLEFFLTDYKKSQLLINVVLSGVIFLFTFYASEKKSKYYTTFWVESVPILWLLLVVAFR